MEGILIAMWSLIFPNAHDRRLIPEGRLSGPMPWVVAIMIFLTVLAAAAGLAVRSAAQDINADLAGRVTVQIIEANPDLRAGQYAAAVNLLRDAPGIARVDPVPDAEIEELMAPWLGGDAGDADIPLPSLIDLDLAGRADAAELERIRALLADAAPSARVDANANWLGPVFDLLSTLQWLALGLVLLLALATTAAVVLSARSALKGHQDTIEIVHLLGSTDKQVARLFQRRIALDALLGGLVGLVLAVLVILLIAAQVRQLGSGLVEAAMLGWTGWLLLALIPVAGMLLAFWTARLTIMRALGRAL